MRMCTLFNIHREQFDRMSSHSHGTTSAIGLALVHVNVYVWHIEKVTVYYEY